MTRNLRPTALTSARRSALLGFAALGAAGAIVLGPAVAHAAPAEKATTQVTTDRKGHGERELNVRYEAQPNFYYCGPAATRIALSAHDKTPSFDALANDLGTTTSGTNSIDDITRVLNANYGDDKRYVSVKLENRNADDAQTDKLRTDVMAAVGAGDPVVVNIAGTVTDTDGQRHSYEGGHYLTATGYTEGGTLITITDPADRDGDNEYQVPVDRLADWAATRGYTH